MKKLTLVASIFALQMMVTGCQQAEGEVTQNEAVEQTDITEPAEDQSSETGKEEKDVAEQEKDIDTYLNEQYTIDQMHYETDEWESESGVLNYTVKLLPDTEAYSLEMEKQLQYANGELNEEVEALFDTAERIMEELPERQEQSRVDSVSWVSYNGDATVTLIQDFENSEKQAKESLSEYTTEQIEYARVWLQFGANQDIDELNVWHIPAGEKLNPDDETSASYPEDVIQLAGSRLVDGSVTYSGNGDGTINVYNVPLRWDGKYPAGEDFYKEIIDQTKLVPIDTGDDQEVIGLIQLLNDHK
ncbi:hypothetical protein [Halobacillus salinus]|uniref:hypothetical protein n=1 Tax=Halobacillus salinus TaxID=192814 RepID=UPI001591128C